MDERKRPFRKFLKYSAWSLLALCLSFLLYGSYVYWQTQNIENPEQCMITQLYHVNLCPQNANYIHYKDVPKHFFQALILSEDASFYSHKGFDWVEIKESFRRNIEEWRFARGGSTLTQQLAKNMYLSKEKSLSRKFKEFFIAKQIEKKLSKAQILEKYVNVVEFGNQIYGLSKASSHYFDKNPSQLSLLESIYLVSLLPSPVRLGQSFNNKKLSKNNIWRMEVILKRMYRTKKISDELFVYLQMQIEDNPWPFGYDVPQMMEGLTIEDQMFEEFETLNPAQSDEFPAEEMDNELREELVDGSEQDLEKETQSAETYEDNTTNDINQADNASDQIESSSSGDSSTPHGAHDFNEANESIQTDDSTEPKQPAEQNESL